MRDALIATGFNRLWPDEYNAANLEQRRQEILDDMTDTTGLAFLGLTFGCARCHDHKFDPIPQTDYYRLQAFFAPMRVARRCARPRRRRPQGLPEATCRLGSRDQGHSRRDGRARRRQARGSAVARLTKFRDEIQQAEHDARDKRTPYQAVSR